MRDFMIYMSELLFQLLNGNPLGNSPWLIVWAVFIVGLMYIPFYLALNTNYDERRSAYGMIGVIAFLPLFMLAIGPPIVQMQMMSECQAIEVQTADVVFQGKTVNLGNITLNQCRVKDNYYDDFGEWHVK